MVRLGRNKILVALHRHGTPTLIFLPAPPFIDQLTTTSYRSINNNKSLSDSGKRVDLRYTEKMAAR
jgi:hypothetical protein